MGAQPPARPFGLAGFYLLYFMATGVALPFLPGYFKTLEFNGSQAGLLLAVAPAFSIVMPPLWGQLADRSGRPGLVLFATTLGGALGYFVLSQATTFSAVFIACCVQATFASSLTSLADALALQHVKTHGGSYAALRRWGSLGFVLTSLPFGYLVTVIDRRAVVVPFVLLSLAASWVGVTLARAPRQQHVEGPRPDWRAAWALLRRRDLALFLCATALHWIACAPYHGSLAPHVAALGLPPSVVGLSSSLGVASELVVMITWPRWATRVSPRRLLTVVFVASAVRWAVMATTTNPVVLVTVAALHGLTFGAFYLASVTWVMERTPDSLRATGQALFVAVTFGLGGIVGYRGAGALYDALRGHGLFAVAAAIALLPALVIAALPERAPKYGEGSAVET